MGGSAQTKTLGYLMCMKLNPAHVKRSHRFTSFPQKAAVLTAVYQNKLIFNKNTDNWMLHILFGLSLLLG